MYKVMQVNPGQLEGTLNDEYNQGWLLHTATQGTTGRWTLIFETDRMRAALVPAPVGQVGKAPRKSRKLVESFTVASDEGG